MDRQSWLRAVCRRHQPILWDWFFGNGGNNRTTRTTPTIPGLSTRVDGSVVSPSTNEISLGVANVIGRAEWRLDYVHRKTVDMYGDFLNQSTGKVPDSTGRLLDLTIVNNSPQARRAYDGVTADARYRFPRVQVGANYTLSKTWGNFNGENVGSGPIRASFDTFPEYRQESWNYPMGYNPGDQRHKARAWISYAVPVSDPSGAWISELCSGLIPASRSTSTARSIRERSWSILGT